MPNYPDPEYPEFGIKLENSKDILGDRTEVKRVLDRYGFMLTNVANLCNDDPFFWLPSADASERSRIPHTDHLRDLEYSMLKCEDIKDDMLRSTLFCSAEFGYKSLRKHLGVLFESMEKDQTLAKSDRELIQNKFIPGANKEFDEKLGELPPHLIYATRMRRYVEDISRWGGLKTTPTAYVDSVQKDLASLGLSYEHFWRVGDVLIASGKILHYRGVGSMSDSRIMLADGSF